MLNGVAHNYQKTQPIVMVLVAIALVKQWEDSLSYQIMLCQIYTNSARTS